MGLYGWKKITNRKARIFISSTFEDLKLERKTIIRQVFPRLRREFSKHFIDIVEIDLRWGVLDEEIITGNIIEICVGEVRKCTPFFLGLIGTSYGTVPDDQTLRSANEFILQMIPNTSLYGISITEMEMRTGLLYGNNKKEASVFIKNTQRDERLKSLIELVETQKYCNTGSYESINELVEKVYTNLYYHIKNFFVDDLIPPKGDVTYFNHLNIVKNHYSHYYANHNTVNIIEQIVSEKNICYIQGTEGSGKSAIVSYFINYFGNEMDELVFFHFMQLNNGNKHIKSLLGRLYNYIKTNELCEKEIDVMQSDEETIRLALRRLNHKIYIIIDDVDEIIADHNYLYDFYNLASPKLKFILTGKQMPNNKIPCYKLTPLLEEQIPYIIQKWYSSYDKNVSVNLSSIIKINSAFKNPMILSFFLDELKVIGENRTLISSANEYLHGNVLQSLIKEVVNYAKEIVSDELLKELFTIIILSKDGLHESDIIMILDIPTIKWVSVYSILSACFRENIGVIQLRNKEICNIIEYLLGIDLPKQKEKRKFIINYFKEIELDYAKRECIWQSFQLNNEELLASFLLNYDSLNILDKYDKGLLQTYLVYLSTKKSITDDRLRSLIISFRSHEEIHLLMNILLNGECYDAIVKAYEKYLSGKEKQQISIINCYSRSLFKMAKYKEANDSYASLTSNISSKETWYNDVRFMHAIALNESGYFNEAYNLLKDVVAYYDRNYVISTNSTYSFIYLANLEHMFGELKKSEIHIMDAIKKRKELFGEKSKEIAWTYCFSSPILFSRGKYDEAFRMSYESVEIDICYYGKLGLQYAWSTLVYANQLLAVGRMEEAAYYYATSIKENDSILTICDRPHPFSLTAYNNVGILKWITNKYEEAKKIMSTTIEHKINKLIPNHCYLANSYVNLANMIYDMDNQKSLELLNKADKIYSTHFPYNHPDRMFLEICRFSIYHNTSKTEKCQEILMKLIMYDCEDFVINEILDVITGKTDKKQSTTNMLPKLYLTKNNICEFLMLPRYILDLLENRF